MRVQPFMTRLRCSVESSNDTASILRGCEMAWGLTMTDQAGGDLDFSFSF